MEQFIQDITRTAGKIVQGKFGTAKVLYTKTNPTDVVTEADLAANALLVESIRKRYPDHGIVSEETPVYQTQAEYVWYIDPLDGTRNFCTRTPLFGVMVALTRRGQVEAAAIHDPLYDELFFAARGRGAWRNGESIRCSATTTFSQSFGCMGSRLSPDKARLLGRLVNAAISDPFWISCFGSAAMSAVYVSDGRRDWFVGGGGGVWDYAAPALVLSEAGCTVTNLAGEPWTTRDHSLVAATPALHERLLQIITR